MLAKSTRVRSSQLENQLVEVRIGVKGYGGRISASRLSRLLPRLTDIIDVGVETTPQPGLLKD